MRNNLVRLLSLAATIVVSITGCINDGLGEPGPDGGVKGIATLEEQAASVQSTISDVRALQEALGDEEPVLAEAIRSMEDHVRSLKGAADWTDATLATLDEQKSLALAVGTVLAGIDTRIDTGSMDKALRQAVKAVEEGSAFWLGKHLISYYPVMAAKAKIDIIATGLRQELTRQKIYIEGLASDIEADLKKGVDIEELAALTISVDKTMAGTEELAARLSSAASEVEEGYSEAIATAAEDPDSFDAAALTSINKAAANAVAETETTLTDLAARVKTCEDEIVLIKERVATLEGKVEDLEELLDLIQSVTFMSEYSEENAVAYYALDESGTTSEGYMLRTPETAIKVNYIVRPASAAEALTQSSLWNDGVKVIGYYAEAITKSAAMFDYDITDVTASEGGVITVTIANGLKTDFFYRKTGAKLALSITTGKTDIVSKFVEIVPKDRSGRVYPDEIELSTNNIEMDDDQTTKLSATISPSDAYNRTVIWSSSDTEVVTVAQDGTVTGKGVGTAVITATSQGHDEWGQKVTATCNVKINSSIKINGPDYVEVGESVKFTIKSPDYISPEYLTWEIGNLNNYGVVTTTSFANVDEDGTVHGLVMNFDKSTKSYVPLTLRCTIAGAKPIVLTQKVCIVAVQPKGLKIEGMADTDSEVTMKLNSGRSFKATMMPEEVDESLFRIVYSDSWRGFADIGEGGWVSTNNSDKVGTESVTVSVQPIEDGGIQYDYTYPKGSGKTRNFNINVEPYYVTGISFTESGSAIGSEGIELASGGSTSITPVFTSDGGTGIDPTFPSVTWTTSDASVVTVENGTIKAVSEENGAVAYITATTSDSSQNAYKTVSATFKVTVTKAWHSFSIGDYVLRLSDGTIGFCSNASSKPSGSTIVGIVISDSSPRATDTLLPEDCTHGIAIGLNEGSSGKWISDAWAGYVTNWASSNNYQSLYGCVYSGGVIRTEQGKKMMGYNNTLALKGFIAAKSLTSDMITSLNNNNVTLPEGTSTWYIPSVAEMDIITGQSATLNTILTAAGGNALSNTNYWTSSEQEGSSTYAPYINPMNGSFNSQMKSSSCPVRFIFAF